MDQEQPLTEFQTHLLAGLTSEQKDAVTAPVDESMLVVAGAGTGKTRTLVSRCAWFATQGVDLTQILLLTFTNRAAREIRDRLVKLFLGDVVPDPERMDGLRLPQTGTFHGFASRWLRREWEEVSRISGRNIPRSFTILDQDEALKGMKEAAIACLPEGSAQRIEPDDAKALALAMEMHGHADPDMGSLVGDLENAEATVRCRLPRANDVLEVSAAKVVQAYIDWKDRTGTLDYNDLIALPVLALREMPEIAPPFQGILVDEYQDTDTLQEELLQLLRGTHPCPLVCVGDDAQLLYEWRGAKMDNILGLPERIGCTVHSLTRNWRSPQRILDVGNRALKGNRLKSQKELVAAKETPRGEGRPIPAHVFDHPSQEAGWIIDEIKASLDAGETKPEDHAVLARTARTLSVLNARCARAGVPYRVTAGRRFAELADVRNAGAWLRLLVNPTDEPACIRALMNPKRGLGKIGIEKIAQASAASRQAMIDMLPVMADSGELKGRQAAGARSFHEAYRRLAGLSDRRRSPREILSSILKETGVSDEIKANMDSPDPDDRESARERRERVDNLLDLAQDHETLTGLSEHLAIADAPMDTSAPECVTLSTVHAAKGCEWPQVWIIGMEESILPVSSERLSEGGFEEERRILHVAATRAQEILQLSRVQDRRGKPAEPSRFLAELGETIVSQDHTA